MVPPTSISYDSAVVTIVVTPNLELSVARSSFIYTDNLSRVMKWDLSLAPPSDV